jgi:hypothetical protein
MDRADAAAALAIGRGVHALRAHAEGRPRFRHQSIAVSAFFTTSLQVGAAQSCAVQTLLAQSAAERAATSPTGRAGRIGSAAVFARLGPVLGAVERASASRRRRPRPGWRSLPRAPELERAQPGQVMPPPQSTSGLGAVLDHDRCTLAPCRASVAHRGRSRCRLPRPCRRGRQGSLHHQSTRRSRPFLAPSVPRGARGETIAQWGDVVQSLPALHDLPGAGR